MYVQMRADKKYVKRENLSTCLRLRRTKTVTVSQNTIDNFGYPTCVEDVLRFSALQVLGKMSLSVLSNVMEKACANGSNSKIIEKGTFQHMFAAAPHKDHRCEPKNVR